MRAALYARVSTRKRKPGEPGEPDREPAWKQDPEVQLQPLRQLAQARGWQPVEYVDRESGAKESREALDRLMAGVKRGAFQVVVVWKFDRFARTVKQLVTVLDEFRALGVDFVSHTEAVDTTTPMGRAMFGMLAVFAEFERETLRERVRAGIARRRAKGLPVGRQRRVFSRDRAAELRAQGWSWRRISQEMQESLGTVVRGVREYEKTGGASGVPKSL